jgi:hypothetical protein
LERAVIEFVGPAVSKMTFRRRRWRVVKGDRQAAEVLFGPTRDEAAAWEAYHEAAHPPPPYAIAAQVVEKGISLSLLPHHHELAVLPIESAFCYLHLEHHRPVSETFGRHELSPASPLRVVYPGDFEDADWPLEPGEYQFGWEIREPSGRSYTIGRAVTIEH